MHAHPLLNCFFDPNDKLTRMRILCLAKPTTSCLAGTWLLEIGLSQADSNCAIMCNPQSHGCSHQAIDKFSRISRRDVTGIIPKRPSKFGFDFGEKLGESWAKMIQK
jgi:hypothetical protein